MAKHSGCGCDSVGALDTGSIMTEGGNVISAYGGFWVGEYLTEQVDMLKDNKLISGVAKMAAAIGLPMLFPSMVQNKMVAAGVLGFGVSGAKDTLIGITETTATGVNESGWDNYDRNTQTEDTTYREVKVEV